MVWRRERHYEPGYAAGPAQRPTRAGSFLPTISGPTPVRADLLPDSGGDSYYHGLFIAVRRRSNRAWISVFSYTFSKSIDDMSIDPTGAATGGGLSSTNSRTPTDIHNWRLDRALSDFNNTHVLLPICCMNFRSARARTRFVAPSWAKPNYWRLVLHRHLRVPERRTI